MRLDRPARISII